MNATVNSFSSYLVYTGSIFASVIQGRKNVFLGLIVFCVKLPGAQKPEEDYQRFLCEDRTRKYDPKAHEKQPIHDTTLSFPRITAYKTTSISITLT